MIGIHGVPLLSEFGISLAGISEAQEGFSWRRLYPVDTQVLATVSGEGEVWIDGKWKSIAPGFAYVTPPGMPHAYRAVRRREWNVCWVVYPKNSPRNAVMPFPAVPEIIPFSSRQLWYSLEGACDAAAQETTRSQTDLWVQIVHHIVIRNLNAARNGGRHSLESLWGALNADLARAWSLDDLARLACMNKENLRRVCQRELGMSPMRYLTSLRISRAAELLTSTSDKLLSVAERIGYSDPFAFSVAFKRQTGMAPSEFRSSKAPHFARDDA